MCESSIENVKAVALIENSIIRLGTSIMCPSEALSGLWKEVQKRHNNIKIEVVPFDVTPNSEGYMIPYPGTTFDVVVSTFDDAFLEARNVNGLIAGHVPFCVNMSENHRLASKELIELEDLEGETLITVEEARSVKVASFRKLLAEKGIKVKLENTDSYSIDIYNRCAGSDAMLLGMGVQIAMHPLVKRIPVNVDITNPFGIIYAKEPTPLVKDFIEKVNEIVSSEAVITSDKIIAVK